MNLISTRKTAIIGSAILEVVVAAGTAQAIQKMMVERLGASFYPDHDASKAVDPKAPTALREEIFTRYLNWMRATA
jgi:hypothetical protein